MSDFTGFVLALASVVIFIVCVVILVPFLDHFGSKISKSIGSPITKYWEWAEDIIQRRGW